jgi:hypothetical protein
LPDIDAIRQLKAAADAAWERASPHIERYLKARERAARAPPGDLREICARNAKDAIAQAEKWLRPMRGLLREIKALEEAD